MVRAHIIACCVLLPICWTPPAMGVDIALSGFNQDVVLEKGSTAFAHEFDGGGGACWVEQGYSSGVTGLGAGLPNSRQFTSASGSGIVYDLQPYNAKNVLRLGDDAPLTGTLAVVSGRYGSLHFLTSSAAGPGADRKGGFPPTSVDLTLNFMDGSVGLAAALPTHDWDDTDVQAPGSLPPIAISVSTRALIFGTSATGAFQIDHRSSAAFCMYESSLGLSALGLDGRLLQSITFQQAGPAADGAIGIFAVDGTPVRVHSREFADRILSVQRKHSSANERECTRTADCPLKVADMLLEPFLDSTLLPRCLPSVVQMCKRAQQT